VTLANGVQLSLVLGDLTLLALDAIVNAANARLRHGGGLAGAIVRRAGPEIQQQCDAWLEAHGPAGPGRPALTGAGKLPSRHVIHAVGPVWGEGQEDRKLAAAVGAALDMAEQQGFQSLGLPAISTGIFGFPKPRAARIMLAALDEYAMRHPAPALQEIWLVLLDQPTLDIFVLAFDRRWPDSGGPA